jgi:hypothetical protein
LDIRKKLKTFLVARAFLFIQKRWFAEEGLDKAIFWEFFLTISALFKVELPVWPETDEEGFILGCRRKVGYKVIKKKE